MPLKGVKVLEFVGLAPGPFCGKILVDFGAKVTRIDRVIDNVMDVLQQGKSTLVIDLKKSKGQQLVMELVKTHDVLIEPFRPGVMENLNLGPTRLLQINPRLIYARLTGFGQTGPLKQRAGHDINYAAISGVLSMLRRQGERPMPPINILADFAGGGLMCAFGICLALLERARTNCGQVVDSAMVDGAAYVASWLFASRNLPVWQEEQGTSILDGGAYYYDVYETKDGGYMSVGALEPQFFTEFKQRLNLPQLTQSATAAEEQRAMREMVRAAFLKKTLAEWSDIFENCDACVYPVVDWQKAWQHKHNAERKTFVHINDKLMPMPAPRLSSTPGSIKCEKSIQEATNDVLLELKKVSMTQTDIQQLIEEKVIQLPSMKANL